MTILAYRDFCREGALGKIHLTLACWNYDRTRPLAEGRVPVDGVDLTYLNLPVEETFFRMLRYHEFDAAEMSLSSYVMSLFSGAPPFVAIPVFPSRSFRHSCIFINRNNGIREPQDLIGKKVGSPEYQLTAPVWIRGILSDEFRVPVSEREIFHRRPGRAGPHRKDEAFFAPGDSCRADSTGENARENARLGRN